MTFDRELERWIVEHRVGWLDPIFIGLSWIGSEGLVWLVLALVAALVWRQPALFFFVASADLVAGLSAFGLRQAIDRPRPSTTFAEPHPLVRAPEDPSFPSGHSSTSFACAVVLARALPQFAVPLLVLAAAIAASRVYVGVHYPLDVLGGAVLGVALATALRWLAAVRRRSPPAPPAG